MKLRELHTNESIRMEYCLGEGDPYVVEDYDGTILGYIWYTLSNEGTMFIEMFEVVRKGKGVGKRIIDFLFSELNIRIIQGYAEISNWNSAYYFWLRLGAHMEADEEEMKSYDYGDQIYFELYKESQVLNLI